NKTLDAIGVQFLDGFLESNCSWSGKVCDLDVADVSADFVVFNSWDFYIPSTDGDVDWLRTALSDNGKDNFGAIFATNKGDNIIGRHSGDGFVVHVGDEVAWF